MVDFLKILKKYKNRPIPERKFDQFYATPETVYKRRELILKYCEKIYKTETLAHQSREKLHNNTELNEEQTELLKTNTNLKAFQTEKGKLKESEELKIIFFGDDDLTSIALALTYRFSEIIVLDIDERILKFIDEISKKEKLNIKTIQHNLIQPLPKILLKLKPNFIFFDPPYTPSAVKIWLIRALQILLGKGDNKKRKSYEFLKNKYIFMCYGYTDRSLERGFKVQEIINDLGLVIQEKFRKFNKYKGAETINNESDLYVIQPTSKIKLDLIDKYRNKSFEEKIYTWEA